MHNKCCFCGETRFELLASLGLPSYDSIIYENDHLYITPDIAPITTGHLLLITKMHINCFGEADNAVIESLENM